MRLGENIYKYRMEKNWSQTDLAEALEVSRQSISKWENSAAVPELDKLIKMSTLFDVSLDELVFSEKRESDKPAPTILGAAPPIKIIIALMMMVFGMIFFLLSVFWGDYLYFGEAFGEIISAVIVLISLAMLAVDNFKILAAVSVIYFIYTVVCFGILSVTSITSYIFTGIAGLVIFIWFITYGLHATAKK